MVSRREAYQLLEMARVLIEKMEWAATAGWDGEYCICPSCGGYAPTTPGPGGRCGHTEECELMALLTRISEALR